MTTDKGRYLKLPEQDEREETSSGSSSHSGSPGGGERSAAVSKDGLLAEEEEEEEEGREGQERGGKGERGRSHRYTEGDSRTMELGGGHSSQLASGSGEMGVASWRVYGGRSDSLGRGQKQSYQLKRYPSNDSMSSSSTLVSKLAYEHDDNLADIFRSATGQGLTQSNVQDHLQLESRRSKHGSRQSHQRANRHPRQPLEEGGGYGYMRRREKFMEERENGGRTRGERREGPGKRSGKEEEAGENGGMGGG